MPRRMPGIRRIFQEGKKVRDKRIAIPDYDTTYNAADIPSGKPRFGFPDRREQRTSQYRI